MVRLGQSSLGGHSLLRNRATMKLSKSIWVWGIALVGLILLLAPAPAPAGGSVPPTQFPKPRLISKVSWLLGSAASCGLRGYFAQGAPSKIRKLAFHP